MFAKLSIYTTAVFSVLAVATPLNVARSGDCSTGPVQCCNSVEDAGGHPATLALLGLLGIVVQDVTTQVGITCSPITVIGAAGGSCTAQAACCQDNSWGGLVNLGCVPITL